MAELNNKVRCARIIGKSIVSANQNISESVKDLGNSVIEANNDLSRAIEYKDIQSIINKKNILLKIILFLQSFLYLCKK